MALTALQKSRVAFHLDVWQSKSLLSIDREITFITLSDEDKLALVGSNTPAEWFQFEGENLCSTTSILGRIEQAYANISPTVINNSLLVKQAGKVTLRGDELKARQKLYDQLLESLLKIMGYRSHGDSRVGF